MKYPEGVAVGVIPSSSVDVLLMMKSHARRRGVYSYQRANHLGQLAFVDFLAIQQCFKHDVV